MTRIDTNYVGMSTMEGTCEGVEVIDTEANQVSWNGSTDEFVLIAGSAGGSISLKPENCIVDFGRALTFTIWRLGQLEIALVGGWLIYEDGDVRGLMALPGIVLMGWLGRGMDKIYQRIPSLLSAMSSAVKKPSLHALWKEAWSSCGRPGGGLKKKVTKFFNTPIRRPQPATAPQARASFLPDFDFTLPEVSPETVRNTAAAAGTLAIIGGMIVLLPVGI